MTQDQQFAKLVSVACHDLLTPLATVAGFAQTLERLQLGEPAGRYLEMVNLASGQIRDLVDQLRIVASIEAGRYDPARVEVDSLELARGAAESLDENRVRVTGRGEPVRVPPKEAERAVAQLARAASRHGGHDHVELEVRGSELVISPLSESAEPVVLGEKPLELGAPASAALIRALGGSLAAEDGRLTIRLPTS
ncbi:MAG: histidine kinase dimerization/phospho-acceptor domain-containing protein [Gaiellaceae bacterium]